MHSTFPDKFSSLHVTGTQFHPALRGAGGGGGRLVSDSDGAHRVSTQQPVLQPTPAPLTVQQVAAHAETDGWRDGGTDEERAWRVVCEKGKGWSN